MNRIAVRLAIISDIHSNLEALEAVLADIRLRRTDRVVCLGDVVGYGADPEACITLLRSSVEFCVRGNHDHAAADPDDRAWQLWFNSAALEALRWTASRLGDEGRAYLQGLPLRVSRDDML